MARPAKKAAAAQSRAAAPNNSGEVTPEPEPTEPEPSTPTERPTLADETDYVRALYYGDPGKAKTTNAMAMARLGKVIAIDSESGMKPAALRRQGIPVENIEPYRDIGYQQLLELVWDLKGRLLDGEPIVGVVWDSITATLPFFIDDLVRAAVAKAERRGEVRDSWVTYQDDYGAMTNQIREIYRILRDLPCHLALTAHARKGKDEEGMVEVGPNVTPALQNDLFAYSDLVLHVRTLAVGDLTLYTGVSTPTGRFKAKDRYGVLPANMVTPSFDRLVEYVNGSLDLDTDEVQQGARAALAQAAANNVGRTDDDESKED